MTIRSGRLKWYGISFDAKKPSVKDLAAKLEKWSFLQDEETSKGFKLEGVGKDSLRAKFISKSLIEQTINLPTGGDFVQIITDISTIDFHIEIHRDGYVRVENPPRSMVQFFNSLALAFDFECSIDPIEIDVDSMLSILKGRLDGVEVSYMDVSSVWLGSGVQLRAAVAGESGVEEELKGLLDGRKSTIEGVRLRYISDGALRSVEINRRAGVKLLKPIPDDEFEVIKSSLTLSILQ